MNTYKLKALQESLQDAITKSVEYKDNKEMKEYYEGKISALNFAIKVFTLGEK